MKKLIIILLVLFNLQVLGVPNAYSEEITSIDELKQYVEWVMHENAKIKVAQLIANHIYNRVIYWQEIKGIK